MPSLYPQEPFPWESRDQSFFDHGERVRNPKLGISYTCMSKKAIRCLSIHGCDALKASRGPAGSWKAPKVSKRLAAMIRKRAINDGTFGSFDSQRGKHPTCAITVASTPNANDSTLIRATGAVGGWNPAWDAYKKPIVRRPPKLRSKERTREDRFQRIHDRLAEQPQKIEENRRSIEEAKPKPGIATLYKRLLTRRG